MVLIHSGPGKMVRSKIVEDYESGIDYLYTPEAINRANPENPLQYEMYRGLNSRHSKTGNKNI
jgi:hypothetical protein